MTQLSEGQKAPDFTLATLGGGSVTLSEELERADKGVIVYFYPKAMTPGCTKQACDFRDSENSLASAGYRVIGISPDKVESLEKFTAKENLNFPLASDPEKDVMIAWGAYGEKKNYGRLIKGVIRSTIVVAKDGTVAKALYNVKATGHVARLRRELGIDK
ncbi:thioredoxin-dependent thiol peroxidase [Arcanobacterium haemolyticum]|uniref:thioredoxin-dependent peroxiredoxin n=1 Tax=Arcanobacterium haemolyticum (strain ATCC 9345 / DSM 20595 / CCM 5947 / CCUG 17215 / LMG 16163 / NBRC 15585 / NCTC 8452 / 11018) TaxID=644284 RepID=D7BPH0_ARCHD|nr:thioredoxin-dependent thiol peroxidase [Arcanobacterium haemolyticum]ADH92819.1 alkyl hydroperoxide reductase/ Thiol specific antioxidant/ Mal allergen [Arcanobacterium haemolyticum DSM 20595]QCX46909.1 thioredoxin-dependent thiol peroxidase [Arcanobacterium haemolyticum]SPT75171.1 Putative peroxiredoxin Rv2521/MT2597 [Arcanobacterium haemolyticum]SQH28432.1 Putative peroxiredoxin Rv2521/MT2597 [Arcanobacterium haemolyticum]